MSTVFLPGQIIPEHLLKGINTIGCGIDNKNGAFVAVQAGLLRLLDGKAWISVQSKRYIPQEGDCVLGVVNAKQGDLFKIDIGSADLASISFLNFEGATKRNRPNLKIGDLIYARIAQTSKHLEPELTCVDQYNRAKGLGQITSTNGLFVKIAFIRRIILDTEYVVDQAIPEFVENSIRRYRGFTDLPMETNR